MLECMWKEGRGDSQFRRALQSCALVLGLSRKTPRKLDFLINERVEGVRSELRPGLGKHLQIS